MDFVLWFVQRSSHRQQFSFRNSEAAVSKSFCKRRCGQTACLDTSYRSQLRHCCEHSDKQIREQEDDHLHTPAFNCFVWITDNRYCQRLKKLNRSNGRTSTCLAKFGWTSQQSRNLFSLLGQWEAAYRDKKTMRAIFKGQGTSNMHSSDFL